MLKVENEPSSLKLQSFLKSKLEEIRVGLGPTVIVIKKIRFIFLIFSRWIKHFYHRIYN